MIKFQPEHTVNIGLSCDINKLSSPISRSSNCSSLVASSSGCSSLPSSYQVYQQPVLVVSVLYLLVTRYTSSQLQWLQFFTFQLPGILVASSSGCSSLSSIYQVYQQPALLVAVLNLLVTRYTSSQLQWLQFSTFQLLGILVASSSGCSSQPSSYQVYQQPALVVAVLNLLVTRYTSSQLQWLQFSTVQLPVILVANSSGCSSLSSIYQVYQQPALVVAVLFLLVIR